MMLNPRPAHLALRRADARGREDAPAASVTGSGRAAPPVAGVALRIAHAADGGFLVSDVASSPARDTTDGLIRPGDALLAVDGQPVPTRQSPPATVFGNASHTAALCKHDRKCGACLA